MSLLKDLFFKVPLTLTKEIFEKLLEEIDKEALLTKEAVKRKLQEYQLLLENGDLTEEEYEKLEIKLIRRLHAIRKAENGNREGK